MTRSCLISVSVPMPVSPPALWWSVNLCINWDNPMSHIHTYGSVQLVSVAVPVVLPPLWSVNLCVYKLKVASVVSVGPSHLAKMVWACSLPQGGTRLPACLPAASFPLGLYGLGQVGPLDWTTYLSRGGGGRRGRFLPLVPHSILATDQMKMQFFPASHFFKAIIR